MDNMEEGKGVDAVYTDFAKAFDKCETGVLLKRLNECGVRGKMGHWLVLICPSALVHNSLNEQIC